MFNFLRSWLKQIIIGVTVTVIGGVTLYYLFDYVREPRGKEKATENRLLRNVKEYTSALDHLLTTAINTAIDSTSLRLLQDDALINQDFESYRRLSNIDLQYITIISRLRSHAWLLERYFELLNELAISDAPKRVQETIAAVVDGLNAIGSQLRESELVPNKDVFTFVTKVAVGFSIRRLLKDELNVRNRTIQLEIRAQEVILEVLTPKIRHDLIIVNEILEHYLLIGPPAKSEPIEKLYEWTAQRRKILSSQATLDEQLETTMGALRALREAFEDLVRGKLDLTSINTLIKDLESSLAAA